MPATSAPTYVHALAALVAPPVELNIEGNPFAPNRGGYPGLQALVRRCGRRRSRWCRTATAS
jgi:hypothetical protein